MSVVILNSISSSIPIYANIEKSLIYTDCFIMDYRKLFTDLFPCKVVITVSSHNKNFRFHNSYIF